MAIVETACAAQLKRLEFIALNSGIPLDYLGIHTQTSHRIEMLRRNITPLDVQTARKIHAVFPTFSLNWLLTGKIPLGNDR